MASSSDNPTQNEEHTRKGGENGGYGEDDFASSLDLLQGKFRKCNLDPLLFGPHPIQLGDPAHFPMNWKNISDNEDGKGFRMNETKKRCLEEMSEYDVGVNLDLELRLSLPGLSLEAGKSSKESNTSPLSSQDMRLALCLKLDDILHKSLADEVPSLCVMGCTCCLMYVMVPETYPKCPKCKNTLMGLFRDNTAKRSRKI